jgi:hypothetical protein
MRNSLSARRPVGRDIGSDASAERHLPTRSTGKGLVVFWRVLFAFFCETSKPLPLPGNLAALEDHPRQTSASSVEPSRGYLASGVLW